jgi:hypothetical protein
MNGFMSARGFGECPSHSDDVGVTYRRGRCIVRFHYYPEDRPKYSPMVTIGLVPRLLGRPRFSEIGLWYAIPESAEAASYPTWWFSSESQLAEVLIRTRDEVLDGYAARLWLDTHQLAELIANREREWRECAHAQKNRRLP